VSGQRRVEPADHQAHICLNTDGSRCVKAQQTWQRSDGYMEEARVASQTRCTHLLSSPVPANTQALVLPVSLNCCSSDTFCALARPCPCRQPVDRPRGSEDSAPVKWGGPQAASHQEQKGEHHSALHPHTHLQALLPGAAIHVQMQQSGSLMGILSRLYPFSLSPCVQAGCCLHTHTDHEPPCSALLLAHTPAMHSYDCFTY
jgi:hypothetical protein